MGRWMRLAAAGLMLMPLRAAGDTAPQVVLASPGAGPAGIERFTLRFSEPMVPLGDPRAAAPVTGDCPGAGRWIDERSYVWEFGRPLGGADRCALLLAEGLTTLAGAEIAGTRRFPVDGGGPRARAVLPGWGQIEEDQVFLVAAAARPDPASIAANAYCAVDGIGERIPVDLLPAGTAPRLIGALGPDDWRRSNFLEEAGLPQRLPDGEAARARALSAVVALKCRRPLPPGRDMALVWGAGIGAGRQATSADQRFDYRVREEFTARFECSRVNPRAGCSPVEDAFLRFSAPVPRAAAARIRIALPDGRLLAPFEDPREKSRGATVDAVRFKAPLPALSEAVLRLPEGLSDESGRPLANARRFPLTVRFDAAPPLVKFAAPFGILEASEGGVLPVTVRAVEPVLGGRIGRIQGASLRVEGSDGEIARWLRDIDRHERTDIDEIDRPDGTTERINRTGAAPLLPGGKGSALSIALPGKGKAFEVVGIPLRRPGFYVVELASPALGRALLGRDAPRYVTAGALVTNMAVHFKWGRAGSLAWVTALDSGRPVAGAELRVTDACTGALLARGTSDRQGRFAVPDGLPEPATWGSCEGGESAHPLMISARKSGDFSFTLTDWGEGIRPYDFDLPYGWSETGDILHTVFDRALIRAGETVHMKHILRRPTPRGFAYAPGFRGTLRLVHRGSDTEFALPVAIGADGIGESAWAAPPGAPQGDYELIFERGGAGPDEPERIFPGQTVRVDEFRLPTMRASVSGPKAAAVRPRRLPVDLFVGYLAGGPAANLPVRLRTAFEDGLPAPAGWDGFSFGGAPVQEGVTPLDGSGEEIRAPLPPAATLPLTLGRDGARRTAIDVPAAVTGDTLLTVEMDYEDANGETLTAAARIPLYPSAVRLGVKTDGWLMKADDLRLQFVTLDPEGRPVAGRPVSVTLYSREILTARRRLIGGFYAYDNQARVTKLDAGCRTRSDAQGLARCTIDPGVSGEVTVVATSTDAAGNPVRAVRSVWLAGDEDWWFGGDNGDRMDLVPEAREVAAGGTARLQVRMPFREATALVTVEREGVLASFVTRLSGKDPVVEVPMPAAYAPDVYVSVLAVRGRVSGWRLWLTETARRWGLPFFQGAAARPTALVDLAKPSYRLGIARLRVGWEGHRLAVDVAPERPRYAVRETAQTDVMVRRPDGSPAAGGEVAFAAVDEALLQLAPNDSWQLIERMMVERPLSVLTATAQTQVVGKRHYGRKTAEPGGGGGSGDLSGLTREDFRPLLLWQGRVKLDERGRARLAVPLADSLTSYRLVAVATDGPALFGTGSASLRTTQDLAIYSGLPPLVRSGDRYGAVFTLRNGTDKPLSVTATATLRPAVARGRPITVTVPPGGARPVAWFLDAPAGSGALRWTVEAKTGEGGPADRVSVTQQVAELVPVETWAATLGRVGTDAAPMTIPIGRPAGALAGRGSVDVRLSPSLAPPLAGVRAYMRAYPHGCFEQRLSVAIATGDGAAWRQLAAELPAYQDRDGLIRYWPVERLEGSEALTAYVLSIASEAGLALPPGPRARMIEALRAVVEGRLRDGPFAAGDTRLWRIAALGALARAGAAEPAMLAAIDLAPADMPTVALTDWLVAIERTPGLADAARRRAAAEAELRRRLVWEGTRLDLVDQGRAPWWMMVGGDEMALRLVHLVIGRPGWDAEAPRLMLGVATRQRRGHWDTTPANAWGTLAVRRFAERYPESAIAGATLASLGAASQRLAWPAPEPRRTLSLPLPAGTAPLRLAQSGGAGPWATVSVRAAVPLAQPLFAGYRLEKRIEPLAPRPDGRFRRGDVVRVRLIVEASAERNWVALSDPLPPGATVVSGLGGQSALLRAGEDSGGARPDYTESRDGSWRGYFAWLPRGRTEIAYTVRLNGIGRFALPPSRVEAMYTPEVRAALPNAPVEVASP